MRSLAHGLSLTLSSVLSHRGRGDFWRKIVGGRFIAPSKGTGPNALKRGFAGRVSWIPAFAGMTEQVAQAPAPHAGNHRGLPLHGLIHRSRGQVGDLTPTSFDYGACRGAKPNGCLTKSQIRNPKRVQGFLPAEGLGVSPNSLFSSPKNGGQGVETPISPAGDK